MRSTRRAAQRGFSLLEMVVAMAILALSLGALYQAVSGATRHVRTDERYAYAVELGRSLLARHAVVPASGVRAGGETAGGFSWSVATAALPARGQKIPAGALHNLEVIVSWQDGRKRREIVLQTVAQRMVKQ